MRWPRRARAARDRAGHAAARRHGPHPARLRLAGCRARARDLRRRDALGARVRGRHRIRGRRRPRANVLVVVYLSGGIDGLSVLFPAGDPLYYQLRPNIALAQTAGAAFSQDSRLRWNPTANALATLHGEGKVSVIPAIGYVNNDESHFTSRHYWEVGATQATLRTGWLGRYLDHVGDARQPAAGAVARRLPPAGAGDREDAGRDAAGGRPVHVRAARPAAAPARGVDAAGGGEHRRCARGVEPTPGSRPPARSRSSRTTSTASSVRSSTASTRPVAYPATTDPFPHRLAGLAAMIAAGLPLRVVDDHLARSLRHARLAGGGAEQRAAADRRLAARLPARPRGTRRRRPRADLRVVGVRAPRARRTPRPAPTTARPASAS